MVSRRSIWILVLFLALCAAALLTPTGHRQEPTRPDRPSEAPKVMPDGPPTVATEVSGSPTIEPPKEPGPTGTISGSVLSPEGRPINRACVVASWRFDARVVDGRYRIDGMRPGRYQVAAAAPGHPPVQREVLVRAGVSATLDFVLAPGGLPVAGTVTTTDGRPLAGAKVSVSPAGDGAQAFARIDHPRTGPDGRFRIEGVPEGSACVTASAPVCRPRSASCAAGTTDLVIALEAGGEIHGTVVLPSGATTFSRYRVCLLAPEGTEEAVLYSDEEREECHGLSFSFRGLAPGNYGLRALVHGVGRADLEEVRVEAGRVTRVRLEIGEGQCLTGRVVSASDGEPVPGALVVVAAQAHWGAYILLMILEEDSAWINGAFSARTDAEGRYRIVGLRPGSCSMAAVAPGFRPVARHGVELPARGDVPDLTLPAAGGLLVRLIGGDGEPEFDVDVIIEYDQESGLFDGVTDARGECRFGSVPPGRRHVQFDTTLHRTIDVETEVSAGKVTEIEIRMPSPGTFVHGVVLRDGDPVAGWRVEARFEDTGGRVFTLATRTDDEGHYRLDHLVPGPVRLAVTERWSRPPIALERMNVLPGENVQDFDLGVERPIVIVVDAASGKPLPTARILMARTHWAVADEQGRVVLPGSTESLSDALVFAAGHGPAPLRAASGTAGEPQRIALTKSTRLTLGLANALGHPVRSSVVEIRESGGPDVAPFVRDWDDDLGDAQKGRYVYDLAPGTYEVRITHPDHATVERNIRLPAEGLQVDLVLP